jgi:hypothetical protein
MPSVTTSVASTISGMAVATLSSVAMGCTANLVAAGEPAPIMVVNCKHCLGRKKATWTYPIDDCVSHV